MIKAVHLWLMTVLALAACTGGPVSSKQPLEGNTNNAGGTATGSEDHEGLLVATATPGSMMPTNPEAAHMMEPITAPNVRPATQRLGSQPLAYREEKGVKIFELTTQAVRWPILDGVLVTAYTYNGTVPGPLLRVTEGERVQVIVKNELPDPTTIHWHGVEVPNAMDGVPGMTQAPIQPGETFTYEFTAKPAGTFMYHFAL